MLALADQLAAEHSLTLDVAPGALYGSAFALFSPDKAHRYLLGRQWVAEVGRTAVWVMLNPSTADAFRADPTMQKCAKFSRKWGCGGMLIANVCAFRATKPKGMLAAPDPVGPANEAVIRAVHEHLGPRGMFICGWGNHGAVDGRGAAMSRMLSELGRATFAVGVNSSGQPQHPLYVPDAARLVPMGIIPPPGVPRARPVTGKPDLIGDLKAAHDAVLAAPYQ